MDVTLSLIETVFREGFIYALMAMGVLITYKILDFPDLSVDGTFPLGMVVAATLISAGVDPLIACIAAFLAGAAAGCVTGILHVKLGITDLLSGILVMTALWSVNLIITGGTAIVPFFNKPTIFSSGLGGWLSGFMGTHSKLLLVFILVLVVKLAIDLYLSTKSGLLLRAGGNNSQYVTGLGKDPGNMKILGLAIGNGCTALSGCVLAQLNENADINSGKGMVVMALASVIIGVGLFHKVKIVHLTTMAILGAVMYKACLQIALQLGLPSIYLKLLMAVLLTIAIVSQRLGKKGGLKNA